MPHLGYLRPIRSWNTKSRVGTPVFSVDEAGPLSQKCQIASYTVHGCSAFRLMLSLSVTIRACYQ